MHKGSQDIGEFPVLKRPKNDNLSDALWRQDLLPLEILAELSEGPLTDARPATTKSSRVTDKNAVIVVS